MADTLWQKAALCHYNICNSQAFAKMCLALERIIYYINLTFICLIFFSSLFYYSRIFYSHLYSKQDVKIVECFLLDEQFKESKEMYNKRQHIY